MCLFITVLLPKKAYLGALRPIYEKYLMDFKPYERDTVLSTIRPNDKCYNPGLHGHCDCSTDLGKAGRKKLSDQKRQRIIKQYNGQTPKPYVHEKGIEAKLGEEEGPSFDIPHWMGFLSECLDGWLVEHIGLFLHFGDLLELKAPSGKKKLERYKSWKMGKIPLDPKWYTPVQVEIKGEHRIPLNELTVDVLAMIEEDVLYEFMPEQ